MLQVYFGKFKSGRLFRLPFLGYTLLIAFIFFLFLFGIIAMISGAENFIGGDLSEAQDLIRNSLSMPFMIVFGLVLAVMIFAYMNIIAKRARDIGLPGWRFVAGFFVLSWIISVAISPNASNTINTIIGFGLLFIPSNAFGKNRR